MPDGAENFSSDVHGLKDAVSVAKRWSDDVEVAGRRWMRMTPDLFGEPEGRPVSSSGYLSSDMMMLTYFLSNFRNGIPFRP